MDGVALLTWVRRNVVASPEILFVSSESPDFLQNRFSGMGVRALLSKPLKAFDLIGALLS